MNRKFTPWLWWFVATVSATLPLSGQEVPLVSLQPFAPPQGAANSGEGLMEQIVQRIGQHASVSAKVRHRAQLFGQKMVGNGVYLQRNVAQGIQVRFVLAVQSGERKVSLLHVCDGRFLWMHDNLDGRPKLSRIDLLRLRQAGAGQGGEPLPVLLGGGLPQLLSSLQANFVVSAPQSVIFQDVPMWALACTWDPQQLVRVWPNAAEHLDARGRLDTRGLPEHMPDRVFLLVGQDDLFPYHIDFRRSEPEEGLSVLSADGRSASRSLTTMELFEVQFDAPLDPMAFVYSPTNIEISDRTDEFLARVKSRPAE
jgi:hypothetical protein